MTFLAWNGILSSSLEAGEHQVQITDITTPATPELGSLTHLIEYTTQQYCTLVQFRGGSSRISSYWLANRGTLTILSSLLISTSFRYFNYDTCYRSEIWSNLVQTCPIYFRLITLRERAEMLWCNNRDSQCVTRNMILECYAQIIHIPYPDNLRGYL